MNVLVVGSGGREHALVWKLATSTGVRSLHAAPGNPGLAPLATCHPVSATDPEGLLALCREHAIELVVVGPEAPLVAGAGDVLRAAGVAVFGPSRAAARIEASKAFGKDVMLAAGVPTARTLAAPRAPCVVKLDGLASGKGVWVCPSQHDADEAWARARAAGGRVLVEELLEGEEVSLFVVTDGRRTAVLPAARDAKRLGDGDAGPNTGGMGAYSPIPSVGDEALGELAERIAEPVLAELARRGAPFVGLLYAGLMLTDDGPRVLEFNCRFGDPETQAILPRLEVDLLELLAGAAAGRLPAGRPRASEEATVAVVLAAPGYPEAPRTGIPIGGLAAAHARGVLVFHAGTDVHDGRLVSSGGRVLTVVGRGPSLEDARACAYAAVGEIELPGGHHRSDIAAGGVRVAP
ncbi:MAG: phosphoribosylamine--glycine ligase [Thermoleophilia bacterium]|nr:phosphoribosylamine--glycine ligase [Thermoleophilia bacterium]